MLFIPFLVIDMVVSSILMSMGMMMLPPVLISLPFKILLFILVDGWHLIVGSVAEQFPVTGRGARMSEQYIVYLFREAFYTTLLVSAPILLLSARSSGSLISVFQAATSIQEFTLTFVPKLIAIAIVTVLTLPWMMDVMIAFTSNLFNQIPCTGALTDGNLRSQLVLLSC